MPTSLPPPTFGASRDGLVAKYTNVQFSGDFNISLPLYGSFQGDPVKAISLYIDNYNNAVPVNYLVSGTSGFVPPYTTEFIDVSRSDNVQLSATQNMAVNLEVHDNPQPGGTSRGLPPNGASDSLWANVIGLWHYDANPGAILAVDSKNAGLYMSSPNSAPMIVTTDSLFGGSSAYGTTTNQYVNHHFSEKFLSAAIPSGDYTVEIAFKAALTYQNTGNVICSWTEANGGLILLSVGSNGSNTRLELYVVNYTASSNTYSAPILLAYTGWLYDAGLTYSWHQVAVTTLGGMAIYVDGVLASQSGRASGGLAGYIDLFYYGYLFNVTPPGLWVDETRITLGTRYTKNYTIATIPFPNQ
jgi:hypothetical protein